MDGLFTLGIEFHEGWHFPLCYRNDDVFDTYNDSMDRYRIIYIVSGSGIIMLNGKRHILIAPTVLCLNEVDECKFESYMELKAETLWFHPSIINQNFDFNFVRRNDNELTTTEKQDIYWLNPFCRRPEGFTGQLILGPGSGKRFKGIIDSIKEELEIQRDPHWPCRSRTYLIELLFLISSMLKIPEAVEGMELDKDPGDMKEIILFIYSNYMNKITLNQLTQLFHVNRTTLTERFNEVMGLPVMEYIIQLRLYLASQMLRETLLPIQEVVERVGFNDSTHFGRMFKKHYGFSPKEFRERNCSMIKR